MAKRIVTYTPKRQRDGWTRYLRLIGKTEEPPMAASSTSDSYPPPGGWCTCCWGTRWWTKRGAPYGWCCGTCHPPDHLRADQV